MMDQPRLHGEGNVLWQE